MWKWINITITKQNKRTVLVMSSASWSINILELRYCKERGSKSGVGKYFGLRATQGLLMSYHRPSQHSPSHTSLWWKVARSWRPAHWGRSQPAEAACLEQHGAAWQGQEQEHLLKAGGTVQHPASCSHIGNSPARRCAWAAPAWAGRVWPHVEL